MFFNSLPIITISTWWCLTRSQGTSLYDLDGVPWQQVLDIILQVKGLDKRVDGNVILVAPKAELDLREQQALEKSRLEEELGEQIGNHQD